MVKTAADDHLRIVAGHQFFGEQLRCAEVKGRAVNRNLINRNQQFIHLGHEVRIDLQGLVVDLTACDAVHVQVCMVGHVEGGILVGNCFIVNGEVLAADRIGDFDIDRTRIIFRAVGVGQRQNQVLAAAVLLVFDIPELGIIADVAAVQMVAACRFVLGKLIVDAV